MFNIGMPELIIIFFVALLIFGPKKLPEVARSIAKTLRSVKRASMDIKQELEQEPLEGTEQEEVKKQSEQGQKDKSEKT